MRRGIKISCVVLSLMLLLVGCTDGDTTTTTTADTVTTTVANDATTTTPTTTTTGAGTTGTTARGVLIMDTKDTMEYKPLPNLCNQTQEDLNKWVRGIDFTVCTDKNHLPKGAKRGLKTNLNNVAMGMAFTFTHENGKETPVFDPCPEGLADYDGLRIWLDVKPKKDGDVLPSNIEFTFGNWNWGYRVMFKYIYQVPKGGYTGYINMPFKEFVDGYNTSVKAADPNGIEYMCIQINAGAVMQDLDVYFADFQAYREKFW